MTGNLTKQAELREILIKFISQNFVFRRGWTVGNCSLKERLGKVAKLGQFGSHTENKAAASVYVATDSLRGSVHGQCFIHFFQPV